METEKNKPKVTLSKPGRAKTWRATVEMPNGRKHTFDTGHERKQSAGRSAQVRAWRLAHVPEESVPTNGQGKSESTQLSPTQKLLKAVNDLVVLLDGQSVAFVMQTLDHAAIYVKDGLIRGACEAVRDLPPDEALSVLSFIRDRYNKQVNQNQNTPS